MIFYFDDLLMLKWNYRYYAIRVTKSSASVHKNSVECEGVAVIAQSDDS